ncbi:hybrid sensor histidine kinase/response regulator [Pseudomonas protegens]|uniref:hybrid sensor histidine kinase/response regulator n=1 Tax=Pseudomonas protegens TaxID=380021 RepID=UPI000643C0D4|nr:hybrid sensor histidine kinase/response regulator [Pseudomonas protegens]
MKESSTLLENLAHRSPRLNMGVMLLGLALLLFATLYWTLEHLFDEQHSNVRLHFDQLMENIQEQELFLQRLATRHSIEALRVDAPPHLNLRAFAPATGQQSFFTMPFSLSFYPQQPSADELPRVFALGLQLSSFYSAFWQGSHHAAPRTFVFNTFGHLDISPPRQTAAPDTGVLRRQVMSNDGFADNQVHWQQYRPPAWEEAPPSLLAYINLHEPALPLHVQGGNDWSVVASLLSLEDLNHIERTLHWSIHDDFTLIEPSGATLTGYPAPADVLREGLNFGLQGMIVKVTSQTPQLWTGLYAISYRNYLDYALWALLGLLVLGVGSIACGWAASRWYHNKVVGPAQRAQHYLNESEAFNRVVIDTVPAGLCVVRRDNLQVILQNHQAEQWHGTAQLLSRLAQERSLIDGGETSLDIDGRYLQAEVVSTRYQGRDVLVCVFNDVTRHVEDARALDRARRSADAANAAKTLFLATMSHEIRTPLYGVLGTLELLGLTRLDSRQSDYLQTIQRSSSTLFQLISDVLDVSRIEAGQMSIDPVEFCPLDMLEDVLHAHAASAQRRGLLFYACIDPNLPDLLLGDAARISQILNNLLSNAIKFTDSGRVVLRVRVLELLDQQARIEWQVTDTGIGISSQQQPQLFVPFFQVRDASNEAGAGLGLAICERLSQMMGGQMQVTSEPGLGSSFSLRLTLGCLPGGLPPLLPWPEGAPVYVRAPVPELLKNTCDWLCRLGVPAHPAPTGWNDEPHNGVLIDMLPRDGLASWPGPCVSAVSGGRSGRLPQATSWQVDAHDIRAIAQAAVLAHQGLPLCQAQIQRRAGHAGQLDLRILVAKHSPINQAIIKEQLQALGCQVTLSSNGKQALEHWQPQRFDIVITDVNMPILNGYELARELRRRDPQLPIIGVTANALREEGIRCLAAGMNTWIVKPMNLQTLRGHLSKLCPTSTATAPPGIAPPALSQPPPDTAQGDRIQVTEKMRPLFLSTMHDDMQQLAEALESGASKTAAARLHSIAGAMGAVQAAPLAKACAELECRLLEGALTADLQDQVRQLMQRLSRLLLPLE